MATFAPVRVAFCFVCDKTNVHLFKKGGKRLALTKERKDELVQSYVETLNNSNGFIIIQFAGMPTPVINGLRAKIRESNGQYAVTKNTLLTKALQETGWPVPDDYLKGPTAIAFGMDNLPGVAKAVLEYLGTQDAERISVKGGVMGTDVFDAKRVDAISKLPTLEELRAQIAGLVVSPATGLVSVLQAANSQLVNVLQAYEDKLKEGDAA